MRIEAGEYQTGLFGSSSAAAEIQKRAKIARRRTLRHSDREKTLDTFWASYLEIPFKQGVNIWLTNGEESTTLAGQSVNVISSMLEESASEDRFTNAFRKSIGRISADSLARKIRREALRVASNYSIDRGMMLNYAANVVYVLVEARGLSPSYAQKLKESVFQAPLPSF